MINRMYSLYDRKALVYSPPFLAGTNGLAVRMVQELVQDLSTTVGRHPQDFVVYCVGVFDDQKGQVVGLSPYEHIVDCSALVSIDKKLPLEEAAQ